MTTTILITGANRGIGLAMAQDAAQRGWRVIGTARDPNSATELSAINGPAGKVRVEQLETSSDDSATALAKSLKDVPVDIVINNAGIFLHECDTIENFDQDAFLDCFKTNTLGPMLVTRALFPNLKASKRKLLVQITSNLGSINDASKGQMGFLGYRTSKAALNMANTTIAHELRQTGIACIAIHPGWVQTDMGGPGGQLKPDQSASSILDTIDKLTIKDSGRFMDYAGKALVW